MRFRARIITVAVAGLPLAGCDKAESAKATTKADTKTELAKQDVKQDPKPDPKEDPKQDAKQDPDPKVPVVIEKPEDIPVALAGAPVAYEPPPPPKGDAKSAPAPAPAPPAAAAAAAPAKPTAIAIAHDHPPGEHKPLTREEVEKALADLKK
jgi:hypothetical protein